MFEELGGTRVYDMSSGNAETFSTETDFEKWKENLWTTIFKKYASLDTPEESKSALLRRKTTLERRESLKGNKNAMPWIINENPASKSELVEDPNAPKPAYDLNMRRYQTSVECRIKAIRQLRQKTDQGSTIEVIYDITGTGLNYVTASNFAMYPLNKKADVEEFAKMFGLNLDTKFEFVTNP